MRSVAIFLFIASFELFVARSLYALNVMDFHAVGDGESDDSQAFATAWEALCQASGGGGEGVTHTTLIIPGGKTFFLQQVNFKGPCRSRNLRIQVEGNISAPSGPHEWSSKGGSHKCWLCFLDVDGLFINGSGYVDGKGPAWWSHASSGVRDRPRAMSFHGCSNLRLTGLTHVDSPRNHISIYNCTNATLSNLHILAPSDSPNTDGVDIAESQHIQILDSFIGTGDDCVAINQGSSDINITRVACGPGHGISVGSLGTSASSTETVQGVNVRHCSFSGADNGARIKTCEGGSGAAKGILFENITLAATKNPIIIDQHYDGSDCRFPNEEAAVKVSEVTFRGFEGTSAEEEKEAITLDCSAVGGGCDGIVLDAINITSSDAGRQLRAYCNNARVSTSSYVSPPVSCSAQPPGSTPEAPEPAGPRIR